MKRERELSELNHFSHNYFAKSQMKIFLRKQKYFSVSAHADKRCEMKIRSDAPLTRINIVFVDVLQK